MHKEAIADGLLGECLVNLSLETFLEFLDPCFILGVHAKGKTI